MYIYNVPKTNTNALDFFFIFSDKIIKTVLIEQNKVRTNVVIVGRAISLEFNYKKIHETI